MPVCWQRYIKVESALQIMIMSIRCWLDFPLMIDGILEIYLVAGQQVIVVAGQ